MNKIYDIAAMKFHAVEKFDITMDVPDTATAAQLKEFDAYIDSVQVNPSGLIIEAYERIFDTPYDDGTESDDPNEQVEGPI